MDTPIRVFLADGYLSMRDALRALITTAQDMEVVGESANSSEIIEQALRLQSDVIVLDLSLLKHESIIPIVSGFKILPRTQFLLLTNEMSKREISAAIDAGVKGYLPKGTAAPEILRAIRTLHRGESVYDPAIMADIL
ncbi:MAG: response regulator transcription factor [Candidatus Promineifilaceae bacterium]